MRITDNYIRQSFLSNLNKSKTNLVGLQTEIATQTKIQKSSENPLSAGRISRLQNQLSNVDTFSKNIDSGLNYLGATTTAMEGMQTETQAMIDNLTQAANPTNSALLPSFGQKLKEGLQAILRYASTEVDGKFVFSGTNSNAAPYSQNSLWFGGTSDTSGSQAIRLSSVTDQKINVTADELFNSVVGQSGTFDKAAANGSSIQNTAEIQDAAGIKYSAITTYTKTGDNAYTMQVDVKNIAGETVTSKQSQLGFDAVSGKLTSVDGSAPHRMTINDPATKLNFSMEMNGLSEGTSSQVAAKTTSPTNMLNAVQSIIDSLNQGQLPTDAQKQLLADLNTNILQKLTEAGNVQNRLTSTSDMMQKQQLDLTSMLSKERDTDVVKATIEMQSAQYTTDLLYKTSAMLLPKSLIDYL